MPFPAITSILAICIGLQIVYFIFKIASIRQRERIEIYTSGNEELQRVVRSHGNLVETAPIFLILLGLCELGDANRLAIGIFAAIFLISRLMHPVGLSGKEGTFKFRVVGMFLTVTVYILTSGYLAFIAVVNL